MADRQAKAQHEIEAQRAQDNELQTYLEVMKSLLLEEGLRSAGSDSSARAVAQAETLAAFSRLDPNRKALALQFLCESSLIQKDRPIVDLNDVPLENVRLTDTSLRGADMSGADLSGADLSGADLSGANLTHTCLADVSFNKGVTKADLSKANLSDADLSGAYKQKSCFDKQEIASEELAQQTKTLEGATMPNGQKCEDWIKSKDREEDK
jgi:uncharacterized protein YjbI with pentapeptide repeats